ncbi:MAG TPA: leucyl/phenylalanyl-tRNA--protein transferase [Ignavibacteria bacterium]|nr:leucyl/phenylalanyl-tRNA--protein transferase [Ignavibacteria bacterium]
MSAESITPEIILRAYINGIFPMGDPDAEDELNWYSPEQRGIIPLDKFKVPKNLEKLYRRNKFRILVNKNFEEVIKECANVNNRRQPETGWITPKITELYIELHKMGFAHSVESYFEGKLVGGLYGVTINGAYFGESMFTKATDASKVALVHTVERLKEKGFKLLDTQFINQHLVQFGAIEISKDEYMKMLEEALQVKTSFV